MNMTGGDTATGSAPSAKLGRPYWRLWTASTISNLGDGMFLVALPLLAAKITHNSIAISLVVAAGMLPWLILSLHAGAIVDRSDKRTMLIRCDVFRGLLIGLLAVAVAADIVEIWMLWIVALGLGVAEVFFDNSAQAILPSVVEPHLLEKANGRRYSAEMTANLFVGTPLGGALFALAVWLPFGVDAVTYLAAAFLVWGLRGTFATAPTDSQGPVTTLTQEVREGFAWLWSNTILRGLAVSLAFVNLGVGMTPGLFILYIREELHVSDSWYGIILAVASLGGIGAGLIGDKIIARFGKIPTLYGTALGWIASLLMIGAFAYIPVVIVAEAAGAFTVTLWNIGTVSIRQQLVPAEIFGRVNSVYRWFAWGAFPIGAALGGVIAQLNGQRWPYFAAAGAVGVGVVAMTRTVTVRTWAAAGGSD